jgi:hypothetical protein
MYESKYFFVSGIHPFSMNHFIVHCGGIRNVPDDVMAAANRSVEDETNMKRQRIEKLHRINIRNNLHIVDRKYDLV